MCPGRASMDSCPHVIASPLRRQSSSCSPSALPCRVRAPRIMRPRPRGPNTATAPTSAAPTGIRGTSIPRRPRPLRRRLRPRPLRRRRRPRRRPPPAFPASSTRARPVPWARSARPARWAATARCPGSGTRSTSGPAGRSARAASSGRTGEARRGLRGRAVGPGRDCHTGQAPATAPARRYGTRCLTRMTSRSGGRTAKELI